MKAIFKIEVGGSDVTGNFERRLISLSVSDKAGQSSDSASIELDDKDGALVMPETGDPISIYLGWEGKGLALVFKGTVDDVRARGGRQGRTLSVSAKGVDVKGKAKEAQRRHFDDKTIGEALTETGKYAGVSVKVDPDLAKIKRTYTALDDESFIAFGERMASEVGGTFKVVGDVAILAKRNGGVSASAAPLKQVSAVWGLNLHSYDIAPFKGRKVEKKVRSRWFDHEAAEWKSEEAETGTERGETTGSSRFVVGSPEIAKDRAAADATESDRKSGSGSVEIEGNTDAQPEGVCVVSECRPGVDGPYRIDSVDHNYSRGGFTTRLEIGQPKGSAGKDSRGRKKKSSPSVPEQEFELPAAL